MSVSVLSLFLCKCVSIGSVRLLGAPYPIHVFYHISDFPWVAESASSRHSVVAIPHFHRSSLELFSGIKSGLAVVGYTFSSSGCIASHSMEKSDLKLTGMA